jgi:hypothetical protein
VLNVTGRNEDESCAAPARATAAKNMHESINFNTHTVFAAVERSECTAAKAARRASSAEAVEAEDSLSFIRAQTALVVAVESLVTARRRVWVRGGGWASSRQSRDGLAGSCSGWSELAPPPPHCS